MKGGGGGVGIVVRVGFVSTATVNRAVDTLISGNVKKKILPLWVASILCGYFPDSTRFEPFFNSSAVNGIINTKAAHSILESPSKLSQTSQIKCFHGYNSTSESINKDQTFISTHQQRSSSPVGDLRP